jgi:alpha-beta hydrolase superfamily lysophospholipase
MPRLIRLLVRLLAASFVVVAIAWWAARPAAPDPFYAPPATLPSEPGALLRQEAFERGVPSRARAWRTLYTTTRADGSSAVASAIVMAGRAPVPGQRPVVAWTHGTTGVVPGCAPSLLAEPFAHVPALEPLIDAGWIFVGTDYVGQGTAGPHPYLVGEGEARSALDAVRAARRIDGLGAGDRTVVWGHSQGGHAALWTGIVQPDYAPDVPLAGVAAMAPASDLVPLLEAIHRSPVGRIMSSYVLRAYGEHYSDVGLAAYVTGWKRFAARDMAGRCLDGRKALFSVAESLLVGDSLFDSPPSGGALGKRLAQNSPDRPLVQPLWIAQGLADDLVLPQVQARFVRRRCAAGQALEYRAYAGRDHLSVVSPDSPLTDDLMRWTRDRFGGTPRPEGCPGA